MFHRLRLWPLFSMAFIATSVFSVAQAGELTLAVANSTCKAMNRIGEAYREKHPVQLTYLCKSSGLLAKGLHGKALDADIYVSADQEWMDFAIENKLVKADQVSSPWGNELVVATPKSGAIHQFDWQDLASDKVTVILIGDPSTAPFGRYTKDSLQATGLWDKVKHKIETRKNIELLAESLASASPSTVGILFKTNLTDQLRQLYKIDSSLHKPIRYYMAPLIAAADNPEVPAFLRFMQSKAAKDIFRAEKFDVGAP